MLEVKATEAKASEEIPVGTPKETSADPGSTDGDDGGLKFDAKAQYQNPLNPEETISGETLQQIVNRGKLFDKAQSERDAARTEAERLTAQYEEMQTGKEKAEAELEKIQSDTRIMEAMKQFSKPTEGGKETAWYEQEAQEESLDAQEAFRRLEAANEARMAKLEEQMLATNAQRIDEHLSNLEKQQDVERFVGDNLASARRVATDKIAAEMPDIPPADIEQILDKQTLATLKDDKGTAALRSGDTQTWQALHFEAEELRTASISELADLRIKQGQITAQKVQEQQIEALSQGTVPEEVSVLKRTNNKAEAKKNSALRIAAARKAVAARERFNSR